MKKLNSSEITKVNGGSTTTDTLLYSPIAGCVLGGIAGALVGNAAFAYGEVPGALIGATAGTVAATIHGLVAVAMDLDYGAETALITGPLGGLMGWVVTERVFMQ